MNDQYLTGVIIVVSFRIMGDIIRVLLCLECQRVSSSSPPGKSEGQTNGFEKGGNNLSKNNINRLLLNNDMVNDGRCCGDQEDETT